MALARLVSVVEVTPGCIVWSADAHSWTIIPSVTRPTAVGIHTDLNPVENVCDLFEIPHANKIWTGQMS